MIELLAAALLTIPGQAAPLGRSAASELADTAQRVEAYFAQVDASTTTADDIQHSQRRRVMTLVREGDCAGAHGAVFVMGDGEMFDLVESQCPVAGSDLERWYRTHGDPNDPTPWDNLPAVDLSEDTATDAAATEPAKPE